jgi:hypothetical protein
MRCSDTATQIRFVGEGNSVATNHPISTSIIPSSYHCGCGYECHFFENTIREMGRISQRKPQFLVEDGHRIEFSKGEAVAVHCSMLGRCPIAETE